MGRKFILAAQKLPIYETSCKYTGKVCIIHGKSDKIVPFAYSERYHVNYADSILHLIEDEGHFMRKQKEYILALVANFMRENLN